MIKFLLLSLIVGSGSALAQNNRKIREAFQEKTKIENAFELRDPFKPPVLNNSRKQGRATKSLMRDGIYTNINPLGDVNLDTLQVVGVMIGKERRALARLNGTGSVVVLREGMILGKDSAELKAIHPGGIIMVEKLVNVYGEEEYLETVIPISQ